MGCQVLGLLFGQEGYEGHSQSILSQEENCPQVLGTSLGVE